MRIERFSAGMGIAVVLLGVSCGAPKLQPEPVPDVVFPLVETARVSVKGPLIPRLTTGPGGLLLAASTSGELQALNPAAKSVAWTYQGGRSKTAPVVDGDKIFWAAEDGSKGKIFCLDAKGHVLWHRMIDEPAGGDLRVVGGKLVFQEGDKALAALNVADGTPAWRDPASLPEEWTAGDNRIVVRTADGRLRALDPEGRLVREIAIGEKAAGCLGLSGHFVYLGYDDGRFGAFDLATGRKKWQMRLGGIPAGPPVSDGRVVLVALSNHVLAALRAKRGDLLWWKPLSGRAAFPPILSKNRVFAASRSAVLQTFDLGDGTETTAFTVPSAAASESREILAPAALAGPNIFLMTGGETESEALVLILDLVPPKPPDKKKPEVKR